MYLKVVLLENYGIWKGAERGIRSGTTVPAPLYPGAPRKTIKKKESTGTGDGMVCTSPHHEPAVSEVMGSILIVAVTVIFALVVGATVLSLAGSMQQTRIVGIAAVRADENSVTITYYGCDKADQLYQLKIYVNGVYSASMGSGSAALKVGTTSTVSATEPGNDKIVVTGLFLDGTWQVVLNTFT